jgi:hypothetical protein
MAEAFVIDAITQPASTLITFGLVLTLKTWKT